VADDKFAQSQAFDAMNPRGLAAKREYVRGLEQRRDPESLSLLVECLCDESWYLRDLAQQAFLRLGEDGAAVILPLLEQGLWFTRTCAAGILGQLAWRPAVPALLRLADDGNRTVGEAACEALVAIGRARGVFRIAHVLHRLPPDARRRRLQDFARRDGALAARIERMLASDELMVLADDGTLADDSPVVRASVEGVEWEVLTSPAPRKDEPGKDEPRKAKGDGGTGDA
jgi:HEAT repeat protein